MTKLSFVNSDIALFHEDRNTYINIPVAEEMKGARYIGEFSVRNKTSGWANAPVSVFWQKVAHPQGSNYFGLYRDQLFQHMTSDLRLMLCNAISATEHEWVAAYNPETKEAVYSAYRHDFQTHDGLTADGGPEYFRGPVGRDTLIFKIKDGGLYVVNPPQT